jgi:hypothetical protein
MPQKKERRTRRIEVITGLIVIVLAFSYITSLLLDFKFVSLEGSQQDDLAYLSEQMQSQMISSCSWLVTSLMTLITIPFYIAVFRRRMKLLSYINGLLMLGASAGFMLMATTGLDLYHDTVRILGQGFEQANEKFKLTLFDQFEQEQFYRHIGSSCVGLLAVGLSLSRIRIARFPLTSVVLLLLSGPPLIFFNWVDPDHLARTVAMAGIIIGMAILCVRLINKGLSE